MVPIEFWRNSDLFKKKNIFLAQKLAKLEHISEIYQKGHCKFIFENETGWIFLALVAMVASYWLAQFLISNERLELA